MDKNQIITTIESPWLSLRAADRYAHVCSGTIAKAVASGELRASKLPHSKVKRVHAADVDDWMRGYTFVPTLK